jgi:hypothetical protein
MGILRLLASDSCGGLDYETSSARRLSTSVAKRHGLISEQLQMLLLLLHAAAAPRSSLHASLLSLFRLIIAAGRSAEPGLGGRRFAETSRAISKLADRTMKTACMGGGGCRPFYRS